MPNKTRYLILPDRTYVVTLDDGDEIEVSGLDIIQMGHSIKRAQMIAKAFKDIDKQEGFNLDAEI